MERNKPYKHSFQSVVQSWPNHSGHHWRPEMGAFIPFLSAAPQSSVNVPGIPDSAAAQVPRALGNLAAGLEI